MNKPRYKRPTLLACLLLLVLLVLLVPVVVTWRAWRQVRLDHALIARIKANDVVGVLADLRQGADPDAQEYPEELSSFGVMVQMKLLYRSTDRLRGNAALTLTANTCRTGDTAILKLLLEHGANPNQKDTIGFTALTISARKGNREAIKMLLDRHADVNLADGNGQTPLT